MQTTEFSKNVRMLVICGGFLPFEACQGVAFRMQDQQRGYCMQMKHISVCGLFVLALSTKCSDHFLSSIDWQLQTKTISSTNKQ